MGDAPTQEVDRVRRIRRTLQVRDFRCQFPRLPMNKPAKSELVIFVEFLVALRLSWWPLGGWMGHIPLQEGIGVGQITGNE